jgi:hypothetical protein
VYRPVLSRAPRCFAQPKAKSRGGDSSGGGSSKKFPAMAVEEARKTDIERSVRFLQRLHDVEGGATQLPTATSAYAAATAKLAAPEARKLGGAEPATSGPGRVSMPTKKPTTESVRDKRAAYFNKMFAAEVGDGDL